MPIPGTDVPALTGLRAIAALSVAVAVMHRDAPFKVSAVFKSPVFRIVLLALVFQTFFLFTANYCLPGGAADFLVYADLLIRGGTTHNASVVSRDIGYPLLLLLSGLLATDSFIATTLIQGALAVLMPVCIYYTIAHASPKAASVAAVASIVSLTPFAFVKWIHHDHLYIFTGILSLCLFTRFVATKAPALLYLFTLSVLATSLTRPAGNALFPVLMGAAYLLARGPLKHYAINVALFIAALGLYQYQRYEMFDMARRTEIPSYSGQQVFYNLYINSTEYGIELSEDLGPSMKLITDKVHQALLPDPRSSAALRNYAGFELPASDFTTTVVVPFLDQYFYPYSAEEFRRQIFRQANWEYYFFMSSQEKDQTFLRASWEIVKAYPLYPVKIAARNSWYLLYSPGYFHTRFNPTPIFQGGLFFPPDGQSAIGGSVFGAAESAQLFPERARREIAFDTLEAQRAPIRRLYSAMRAAWMKSYGVVAQSMFFLMAFGWLLLVAKSASALPRSLVLRKWCADLQADDLIAPILGAALLIFYNVVITATFAEPDYRYHHMMLPLKVVASALGALIVVRVLRLLRRAATPAGASAKVAAARLDVRKMAVTGGLTIALWAPWVWYMVKRTW